MRHLARIFAAGPQRPFTTEEQNQPPESGSLRYAFSRPSSCLTRRRRTISISIQAFRVTLYLFLEARDDVAACRARPPSLPPKLPARPAAGDSVSGSAGAVCYSPVC